MNGQVVIENDHTGADLAEWYTAPERRRGRMMTLPESLSKSSKPSLNPAPGL